MTDEIDEKDPSAEVEEDANTEVEEPEASDEQDESNEDSDNEGDDELPSWAREKLTKANAEAANYRVKLREAEDKLKSAKTPEEVEALTKQMTTDREQAERDLLIENVALKYRLPEKLLKRLNGTTREELEADAAELAEFAMPEGDEDEGKEVHLEGGLTPRDRDADPTNPRELANKYGRRKSR